MSKAPKPMSRAEAQVQRYILKRIQQALDGRSWNWLAQESGIPQTTLAGQYAKPRFSIETLVAIAPVLRRPLIWFFPGTPKTEEEASAFRQIRAIVKDAS